MMTEAEIAGRRLQAGDDLVLWYGSALEMAERARRSGDRGTEMLAQDVAEAVMALADRLAWVERSSARRD